MRLLIFAQSVDTEDPFLSFFHSWATAFGRTFEHVHIVCLKEGKHALPHNVTVHSLGKEEGKGRLTYVLRFFSLAWKLRGAYDVVFVHQNQEYMLLGGLLWRILGKPAYLWRNHYAGSVWTRIAVMLARGVFCTSRFSYTKKFAKTSLMPIGVDTDIFKPDASVLRVGRSILFYARMAPSKRAEIFIEALSLLKNTNAVFSAILRGSPLPKDEEYLSGLKRLCSEKGLDAIIRFEPGAPFSEGPRIFSGSEIYVNLGGSGMYDKTIFEAAACGTLSLASSKDYADIADPKLVFKEGDAEDLAQKLEALLSLSESDRSALVNKSIEMAQGQSLQNLLLQLKQAMKNT